MIEDQNKELQAELYETLHRGNPGDVEHYQRFCLGAERALEVGSGYGRVAIPIARLGIALWALDIDSTLMQMAQKAAAEQDVEVCWRLADMRDFSLPETFDRIIVPYNSLLCLTSRDQQQEALRCIRRHLAPGGQLSLDVYNADPMHRDWDEGDGFDDDFEPVVDMAFGGRLYHVYERGNFVRTEQRLDTCYRFVDDATGELFDCTIEQRYLLQAELTSLLAQAGFCDVTLRADFSTFAAGRSPGAVSEDAEQLVVVASAG